MVKIASSILSADFKQLETAIQEVIEAGTDWIHVDVMDGKFVNNVTPGEEMYRIAKSVSTVFVDTHLMVEKPLKWIQKNVITLAEKKKRVSEKDEKTYTQMISFHIEAVTDKEARKIIDVLHNHQIKVGIAVKPGTSIEEIFPYLPLIDMVLVMTVEPGWGGQKMKEECLEKVKELRQLKPEMDIEVDGGINLTTVKEAKEAGANILVAGTVIMKAEDKRAVICKMKES